MKVLMFVRVSSVSVNYDVICKIGNELLIKLSFSQNREVLVTQIRVWVQIWRSVR